MCCILFRSDSENMGTYTLTRQNHNNVFNLDYHCNEKQQQNTYTTTFTKHEAWAE